MATKKQNNKGTKKIIKTAKKVYKKNKNKKGALEQARYQRF